MDPSGTHVLVDLYGVKNLRGDSLSLLRSVAALADCNVLSEREHVFPGGGRTAFLVLSQSHASMHTWPEEGYVGLDLFSCRKISKPDTDSILEFLRKELQPSRDHAWIIQRGDDF